MWRPRDPETHVVSHKNGTWTVCSPCTEPPTLQPCIPTLLEKKDKNKNNRRIEEKKQNKWKQRAYEELVKQWASFITLNMNGFIRKSCVPKFTQENFVFMKILSIQKTYSCITHAQKWAQIYTWTSPYRLQVVYFAWIPALLCVAYTVK